MRAAATVSSAVPRTPRVQQVASMLDVPVDQKLTLSWDIDLPIEDRDWNIGLIVGPSGSGKSTIAGKLWPGGFYQPEWHDVALVDEFPKGMPIRDIQKVLASTGLNSVSAWLRPYHTLSNGEKFRAEMARLLAEVDDRVAVVDEFTSVVDRQVAKVASYALQKATRRAGSQIVAASCHFDIEDWLLPDWVLNMETKLFTWGSKRRRPPVQLEVREVSRSYWSLFAQWHYLSAKLPTGSTCYGTFVDGEMVCFTAVCRRVHPSAKAKLIWTVRRQVTKPDWQGLGIGAWTTNWVAAEYVRKGYRFRFLTSHPAAIANLRKDPHWVLVHNGAAHQLHSSAKADKGMSKHQADLRMLGVSCFEYRRQITKGTHAAS